MSQRDDRDAARQEQSRHEAAVMGGALAARVVDAVDLFQGQREICIVLDGERYRLRITRRNRLILQK